MRSFPPTLRRKIRKRWARRYTGPFDCLADGIRFRLYPAENHADRTIVGRARLPEIPERQMISKIIAPGMTAVDVGANIGVYTLDLARRVGTAGKVIAFEPHPRTFRKLEFNCRINGFRNICCINSAVGSEKENSLLYADGGGNIGGASMLPEASGAKISVEISVAPLSSLLREQEVTGVDFLKIDVEGYEDRALCPFFDETGNRGLFPAFMLVETVHRHLWARDLIAELGALGYENIGQTSENLLLSFKNGR